MTNSKSSEIYKEAVTPGDRLKVIRKEILDLSRRQFCEKTGNSISEPILTNWEKGLVKTNSRLYQKIIPVFQALGVSFSEEWFLEGLGDPPKQVESSSSETYTKLPVWFEEQNAIAAQIELFRQSHPKSIVWNIDFEGDSYYQKGDIVGGFLQEGKSLQGLSNEYCIVVTKDDKKLVGKLIYIKGNEYLLLEPEALGQFKPITNLQIKSAAKIIWHRHNREKNTK